MTPLCVRPLQGKWEILTGDLGKRNNNNVQSFITESIYDILYKFKIQVLQYREHTHTYTNTHTHMQIHSHTQTHRYMHAYVHISVCTYVCTYMHKHNIHTYTYKIMWTRPSLNNSFNSFTLVVDPGSRNIPTSFSPKASKSSGFYNTCAYIHTYIHTIHMYILYNMFIVCIYLLK